MELLENAIASIQVGVEDYEIATHGRLLSSVRGIHAGILLLYKEALRRRSPTGSNEFLVKAKIAPKKLPNGSVVFVGVGAKTVDVGQIKKHFEALGIATDWKRFDRISTVRNEIEHYYTKVTAKALQGLISNAFIIVRNFITAELHEEPVGLLGDKTWETMLKVSEVYETERTECEAALAKVDWGSAALAEGIADLSCPSCSGSLFMPSQQEYDDGMTLVCRICGNEYESEGFVSAAIANALDDEEYESIKDGGDELYVHCPNCGNETYVVDEEQCAWCGESVGHKCAMCGNTIPPSELMCAPNCGYCDYLMSKDD